LVSPSRIHAFRNEAVDLGRNTGKKNESKVWNSFHLIRHEKTRRLWLGKEKHEGGRTYGRHI